MDWEEIKKMEYHSHREFKENPKFDKSLISSWKDLEIQFYEENKINYDEDLQRILKEYEDISDKIFLETNW